MLLEYHAKHTAQNGENTPVECNKGTEKLEEN